MPEQLICDHCHEEVEEPIYQGNKVYCCQACAFEGSRSADCGGRSDIHISQPPEDQD